MRPKFLKEKTGLRPLEHTESRKGGAVSFTNLTDQEQYL